MVKGFQCALMTSCFKSNVATRHTSFWFEQNHFSKSTIFTLQLHPLRWSLIYLTNHNSWWYTVWRITWRGVATVKAAHTILDGAQCFDVWRQRARTFCHELLRKSVPSFTMSTTWLFQQPFEKAVISWILLIISVLVRVFMSVNIRIDSIIIDGFLNHGETKWMINN